MTKDDIRKVLEASELFDWNERICICPDPPLVKNPNCYYMKSDSEQYEMRVAFILSEVG